jgi:hypothetical protein
MPRCAGHLLLIAAAPDKVVIGYAGDEMPNYLKLPTWADSGHVHAVVETPRGVSL